MSKDRRVGAWAAVQVGDTILVKNGHGLYFTDEVEKIGKTGVVTTKRGHPLRPEVARGMGYGCRTGYDKGTRLHAVPNDPQSREWLEDNFR